MELLETLQQLAATMERMAIAQEENNRLLRQGHLEWFDPDAAAEYIGLNITPSRRHRRQLSWLYKQGFLPNTRSGRPPSYHRDDLRKVNQQLTIGQIDHIGFV